MTLKAIYRYVLHPLSGRLTNFSVIISNVSLMVTADQLVQSAGFVSCGQFLGYPPAGATGRIACSPGPIRGRFVHITIPQTETLTLCEVMIMSPEGTCYYFFKFSIHLKHGLTRTQPLIQPSAVNS